MIVVRQNEITDYMTRLRVDPAWHERDFVRRIRDYLDSRFLEVLLVNGLRGSGKTVGILQAIAGQDAVYVTMEKPDNPTMEQMINFLQSLKEKVIVIDEYTWMSENVREQVAGYLYSFVNHGKRVILSGSESLNLEVLKSGELIHRTLTISTTHMSFPEYSRLHGGIPLNQSHCNEYLTKGSLLSFSNEENSSDVSLYIENTITQNIYAYIRDRASGLREKTIPNCVYTLLYQAIWDLLKNDPAFLTSANSDITRAAMSRFGIDKDLKIVNLGELIEVTRLLKLAGVLIEVPNLIGKGSRTYVTNPALTYQFVRIIFPEYKEWGSLLGKIYEASCMVDLYYRKPPCDGIYYLLSEKDSSCEIDIVLAKDADRPSKMKLYLVECKHAYNYNVWNKRISLCLQKTEDVIFDEFPCCEIAGRFILHPGEENWQVHNSGKEVAVVNQTEHLYDYFAWDELREKLPRLKKFNSSQNITEKLDVFS